MFSIGKDNRYVFHEPFQHYVNSPLRRSQEKGIPPPTEKDLHSLGATVMIMVAVLVPVVLGSRL